MSLSVDENALAQLVAKILDLRGLASAAAAEPPKSITSFCKAKGISRATFYALRRKGLAPKTDEIIVPGEEGINRGRGLKLSRISAESERAWDKQMEQLRASDAAKLEVERAQQLRLQAGKLAAQSPNHISNRNRPVQRRKRR
jgi:hypothetical protein